MPNAAAKDDEDPRNKELERRKAEAELEKAIAEAEKATAESKRAQVSALIPDIKDANASKLDVSGDAPLYGGMAAHHALVDVSAKIADAIADIVTDKKVLVTSDADLATSDAIYVQVATSLDGLISAAEAILPTVAEGSPGGPDSSADLGFPGAAVGAIASAIPAVLSAFSSQRTVKTFSSTVDAEAAIASVAGALHTAQVWIDDFRLLPAADLAQRFATLQALRIRVQQLVTLEPDATKPLPKLAKDVLTAIDAFLTSALTTPSGAKRSPFAEACLREQLHESGALDFVLLVTGASATSQQMINDRPFWSDDKFSVLSTVSVTYALIELPSSKVVGSGVVVGTTQLMGKIGEGFEIQTHS